MAKFKKGDMVVLIGSIPKFDFLIGVEFEITSDMRLDEDGDKTYNIGGKYIAMESHLRKKKPPEEKIDWVEKLNLKIGVEA